MDGRWIGSRRGTNRDQQDGAAGLHAGEHKHVRLLERGRLVWYRQCADATYWDDHWRSQVSRQTYRSALRGRLGFLERAVRRWLPRDGRILEAGCGLAQHVVALRQRGYDAEGVDFAPETICVVRHVWPDLPVRVADVMRLDVRDDTYAGYLSLGVMEHRREGPEPFLHEAWRVLRPGGIGLISVPHLHWLRRWKGQRGYYRPTSAVTPTAGLPFYQYAFSAHEFADMLARANFRILDTVCYDGLKGIGDEIPGARRLLRACQRVPVGGWWLKSWLRHCPLGHMVMFVCMKDELAACRAA